MITLEIAEKVLTTVDAGLVSGLGQPIPGQMCVEAAVCYAMGMPHSDEPSCVAQSLRSLKISLNDAQWSTKKTRATGLRRLALAQLGSKHNLDDKVFVEKVVRYTIAKIVPIALRNAVRVITDKHHKKALELVAVRCEQEGTKDAANAAAYAANAAANAAAYAANAAAYAANAAAYVAANAAAYAAANAAAYAAAYAANAAANAAAYAANAAAYVAANAANAAYAANAAAYVAANAANAAYAANAAAYVAANAANAAYAAKDKVLSDFAEGIVQILIEMKVPGCQWLYLTEL